MYARAFSTRASVAEEGFIVWDPGNAIDRLLCVEVDMCREGELLPPIGEMLRDARRCSLR
jgi:hypothetical protein